MLSANNKITSAQLGKLILADSLGLSVLFLPRRAVGLAAAAGLALAALAASALILYANKHMNGKTFVEGMSELFTLPGAYALTFVFWIKMIVCAGMELRIFTVIARDVLLRQTPAFVTAGAMLLVCAYAAGKGIETRARLGEIIWPVMAAVLIFLIAAAAVDMDFSNLKPTLASPVESIAKGALGLGYALAPLECLLLAGFYVSPSQGKKSKSVFIAVALSGVIAVLLTTVSIGMLGTKGTADSEWPLLRVMDTVRLPGSVIERQDALMFSFWIISIFAVCGAYLFYGSELLRQAFFLKANKGSDKRTVIFGALCVYAISLIPLDLPTIERVLDFVYITAGVLLTFVLPAAVIIIKRALPRILLIFIPLLLTGCWDSVPIENRAFATVIAIDKAEEDNKSFSVSLAFPSLEKDGGNPRRTESVNVRLLEETIEEMDSKTDKEVYLGQAKVLLLGEGLLSDKEMLAEAMRVTDSHADINRMMVTLTGNINELDKYAGFLVDRFRGKAASGGRTYGLKFSEAYEALRKSGDLIIPAVKTDGGQPRLGGGVMLCGGEMFTEIDELSLRGYLWSRTGQCDGTVIASEASSFKVRKHKTSLSFNGNDSDIRCVMNIELTGEGDEKQTEEFSEAVRNEVLALYSAACDGGADIFDLRGNLEKSGYDREKINSITELKVNVTLRFDFT